MTETLTRGPPPERDDVTGHFPHPVRTTIRTVRLRRVLGLLLVLLPLAWAAQRSAPEGELVNAGGLALLDDLAASLLHPALDPDFLLLVLDAALVTVVFAVLGTAGALAIGVVGALVLSDVAWQRRPPAPVRMVRLALRGLLVGVRAIHELIWALLFVSVLGLDPLVAVLAIAVPFGAQTAKVFAETLDGVPHGPLRSLRHAGAGRTASLAYGLLPVATPLLLSYSFYRFECAIRSAVLLGVVGVGGLGQQLVVSLQSRNWEEVWTLVGAVLALSAVVDLWSTKVRGELATGTPAEQPDAAACGRPYAAVTPVPASPRGKRRGRWGRGRWGRWSAVVVVPGTVAAWLVSDVSWAGLFSARTWELTAGLLQDMWPPGLPEGGWSTLIGATLDTLAMALLAMATAVLITVAVGPWATRSPSGSRATGTGAGDGVRRLVRGGVWWGARWVLLVLRSVPPNIWAIVALLLLFPGILAGALALGLYTGGILGRLVAEAWESLDHRPAAALRNGGVGGPMAAVAALTAPSAHHLLAYTLYRFEICVRDTAVVGLVGAAGLGRLLAENFAVFRFPVVAALLLASFAVSLFSEVVGRRLRRALQP